MRNLDEYILEEIGPEIINSTRCDSVTTETIVKSAINLVLIGVLFEKKI